MKIYIYLTWLILLSSLQTNLLYAQHFVTADFEFTNQNALLAGTTFNSNVVVGICDMNGDDLDDIIRLRQGRYLEIQLQQNGRPFEKHIYGSVSDSTQYSMAIADIDGNGINDILLGGEEDGVKLLSALSNELEYDAIILNNSLFYVQGSNFADINGDGFLDAFVCNDISTSRTWVNDGQGNLQPATNMLPLDIYSPTSLNGGNYSSIWTDFDNDNDLDLYISKCFPLASVNDPRRLNQLFVNDGNNKFTEQAAVYGLDITDQSWTTDFQDIDNDGDLDCFIINHHSPCMLMENDGTGHFTDITLSSGIDSTKDGHLQAFFRDFNNDGYVDLLLTGNEGYDFFANNKDKTFKRVVNSFGTYKMATCTVGDVNHDGSIDIYSAANDVNDVLWINHQTENNFFAVTLAIPSHNRNAVGARIELHGSWGVQVREVRSGEGYGIMNSFTQYFGVGTATNISKLVVHWPAPNGGTETYTNLPVNQFVKVVKGSCLYPDQHIRPEGDLVICENEELKLTAPKGSVYSWSNGASSQSISVNSGGEYKVTVINQFGCQSVSYPLLVEKEPDEKPVITYEGQIYDTLVVCRGDLIELSASDALGYQWSNDSQSQHIFIVNPGTYSVITQGRCGIFESDPIVVIMTDKPEVPTVMGDTIEQPGMVSLHASGGNPHWYDSFGNLVFVGNTFSPVIDSTQNFFVEDVNIDNGISCSSRRVLVRAVVLVEVGIGEISENLSVSVFPNPVSSLLHIKWQQAFGQPFSVQLVDIMGRKLECFNYSASDLEGHLQLNVSDWSTGLYMLQVQQYTRVNTFRFIVH